jgi:hypothetical protein
MVKTDRKKVFSFGLYMAVIAMALALAACTSSTSKSTDSSAGNPPGAVEGVVIAIDPNGGGMEIPLDGSSLEAFDASLAQVKSQASEKDYKTLESAIDYLLFYDLGARRDKEKLAAILNGLTGYEVIARVNWRKPAPGKSNAEKGAADAKIIDT